jgi:hypothetical protein
MVEGRADPARQNPKHIPPYWVASGLHAAAFLRAPRWTIQIMLVFDYNR